MKIKKITLNRLATNKIYYDVVNAYPYNNFLIKTTSGYVCSHNCDEISFIRNQDIEKQKAKANDILDTAIGGMKTRFVHGGKNPTLLVLASSKRSEKSFLEEHMKKKLESEKDNVYISQGSVWEVKPEGTYSKETFYVAVGNKFLQSIVIPDGEDPQIYKKKGYNQILEVPIDFKADFIDDIDRALCDFAGISSSSISKYISGDAVTQIVTDRIKNPFVREILEIGNDPNDEAQYYNFFDLSKVDPALRSKPLFIHLDMSVSGDKTGIAGVFIKGKKPSTDAELQSNDLFYSLAFSVSIKAPKGRQVSFEKNRNFIYWLKAKGFNIKGITSDTFQSYDTGQTLLSKGYPYSILSVDRVDTDKICKPYQYLKSTIYDKRLEIYDHELLIQEITELERNIDSGKVDHPDGGCFTGNTKVKLVDGRTLSFLELIEEYKKGKINYVYSMNLQEKRIEPKKILKAWKTKENAPLVKITLDNDEIIECTLNHKFMLRNGEYIEAQNLIPGDSLMPLYIKYSSKGGLKDYRMYYEPFEDKWHFEHRQFANEILDEKHLVHHKNCNKNHNSLDNLIWCSKHAHMKIHAEMTTGSCSSEALYKKSISIQKWHKKNKNTEQYKNRAEKTRESLLKYSLKKYGRNASLDYKNRKIVSIQFLDRKEDVYDIEVEDNHNFALDAGIFVHNSKDVSDALCGAVFNASKHAEEFAYNYGETSEQLLRINSDEYDNDAQQLTLNLEEELKKMHGVLSPGINSPSNDNSEYSIYDQIVIL